MKYVAKNVITSIDETPTALRKKVAEKLGVSPLGLRINVIRREWRRGKTGGYMVVTVEAETNEFIHNTAFFSSDNEGEPIPETTLKRRPVVIGFGIAGAIAAYVLAQLNLKPIVIEAGESLSVRESRAREAGVGFGDGEGGRASYTGMLFSPDNLDPALRKFLAAEGITFDSTDAHQYLPPAFIKTMVKRLHMAILRKGGEVFFESKYLGTKSFLGKMSGIYYESKGVRKFIKTDRLLVANGMLDDTFYLGFSLESSIKKYQEFIYGKQTIPANLPGYFAKTFHAPKGGNRCVLITGLPRPTLLDLGTKHQSVSHAFEFTARNKNAVSYLGTQVSKEDALRIAKEAYSIDKPNSIPCTTVGDFLARKDPLKLGTTKPNDLSRVNLTCVNRLFGSNASNSLEMALPQFCRAFPYLSQRDAIIQGMILFRGVENLDAKSYASHGIFVPVVSATDSMDFAFVSSASYRAAASLCAQGRKAH